jgi:hypothetical protein
LNPKVFIYSPDDEGMIRAVGELAADWRVKSFETLGGLLAKAAQPLASQDTVLILKISSLAAMRELIDFLAGSLDFDLILLIENEDRDLAQTALTARPRMVFNTKPDPEALAAVLEKMRPRMVERAALLSG